MLHHRKTVNYSCRYMNSEKTKIYYESKKTEAKGKEGLLGAQGCGADSVDMGGGNTRHKKQYEACFAIENYEMITQMYEQLKVNDIP